MRAFQQSPTVRLHHWGWVDEHLYVVIDNVVQQRSTLGYDSPVCSSRSLMKCTWSQQDILYTVDNASVYKYLFCVGLLRFSHKNNDWLENERPTLYLTSWYCTKVLRGWHWTPPLSRSANTEFIRTLCRQTMALILLHQQIRPLPNPVFLIRVRTQQYSLSYVAAY